MPCTSLVAIVMLQTKKRGACNISKCFFGTTLLANRWRTEKEKNISLLFAMLSSYSEMHTVSVSQSADSIWTVVAAKTRERVLYFCSIKRR